MISTKAVITYIFGKNKEKLHDPMVIDENVEYICVTDQENLKSSKWKIIYDPMKDVVSLRDKVVNVKFNPFKYTSVDNVCVMDSTFKIKNSLNDFFNLLETHDAVFKKHSYRKNLKDELPFWRYRGLDYKTIAKFNAMAKHDNINLSNVTQLEGCLFLLKRSELSEDICSTLIKYMKFLGTNENMIVTNQCPLSYIVYKNFKEKTGMFNYDLQKKFFIRYKHNSNAENKT